ncbi:MAG: RNA polymerase sigma factor [Planctomycetes bacterium]|nr:RNA polymerase sigma factor [Planctomycetota bacterium]
MSDPERFLTLLAPYRERLLAVSRSLLSRKADADDALQDAILKAWRDFARYREGASFRAWVLKYLVNTVRNRNRLLREELEVPLPAELEAPDTLLHWESAYEGFFHEPESVLATLDEDLAEAIRALAAAERLVLLLKCVGDLSYREIAEALGMPEGTAMSHLARARKRLRVHISSRRLGEGQGPERRPRP